MLLILLLILLLIFFYNTTEKFTTWEPKWLAGRTLDKDWNDTNRTKWDPAWTNQTSKDCYLENIKDCTKYANCGICYKDGVKECIPGDYQGPFFKEDCELWEHTNFYDRFIFGEKVTTISQPWNIFRDIEAKYPSPISVSTLK